MATTSQADFITDWRFTITTVDANAAELAPAQGDRVQLEAVLVKAEEARQRQKYHQGQLQQATRDLEAGLAEGRKLHVKIRNFIRAIYGMESEKLVEFQMRPRRSVRISKESKSKGAKKMPSEAGPTLPPTAAPETDGTIQK